jgi:anti-sigma B factor antagonist
MIGDAFQARRESVQVAKPDLAHPDPRDPRIPGQFEIQRRNDEHGTVLTLLGELDLGTAPELERVLRELEATNADRLLIDLRRLAFMDCAGIAILAQAQRSADANGHRLALQSGPGQVRRLLELTGLVERFTFLDRP